MNADDLASSPRKYAKNLQVYTRIRECLANDGLMEPLERESLDLERISGGANIQSLPLLISYIADIAEMLPDMNFKLANENLPNLVVITGKIINQKKRGQYKEGFYKPLSNQIYVPNINKKALVYPQLLKAMATINVDTPDYRLVMNGYTCDFNDKTGEVIGVQGQGVRFGFQLNELYTSYLVAQRLNNAGQLPPDLIIVFDKLSYLLNGNDVKNYAGGNAFHMLDQLLTVFDIEILLEMLQLFEIIYYYQNKSNQIISMFNKDKVQTAITELNLIIDTALLEKRAQEKALKKPTTRKRCMI